jgi:hypothetical protein
MERDAFRVQEEKGETGKTAGKGNNAAKTKPAANLTKHAKIISLTRRWRRRNASGLRRR